MRLHGRGHETLNIKGTSAGSYRSNYDHSDDELSGVSERIRDIASKVAQTHVIFNNYEDQDQQNACTLTGLPGDAAVLHRPVESAVSSGHLMHMVGEAVFLRRG